MKRDPLGALGTNSGQAPELVDEVLDYAFVHGPLQPAGKAEPAEPTSATEALRERAELVLA